MLVVAGSAGGAGCSTVAVALALYAARRSSTVLVDLDGGGPLLGFDPDGSGLCHWLAAANPPPDALGRLEIEVTEHLSLLTAGARSGHRSAEVMELLVSLVAADDRLIIVDAGRLDQAEVPVFAAAGQLVVVTRLCHLGLARARRTLPRSGAAEGLVVIKEPGRRLKLSDAMQACSSPMVVPLRWDPSVALAIDGGTFVDRQPRSLRALARLLP